MKRSIGVAALVAYVGKDGRDQPGGDREDAIYFVLDLAHDPYALDALQAYADAAQGKDALPELVADLRRIGWIK